MKNNLIFLLLLVVTLFSCVTTNNISPRLGKTEEHYNPDELSNVNLRGLGKITTDRFPDSLSFRYPDKWDIWGNHQWDTTLYKNGNFYLDSIYSICIKSNFKVRYGKLGALIKFESFPSNFPAFWLMGILGMPELDIVEYNGNYPFSTIHYGYSYEQDMKKNVSSDEIKADWFKPHLNYYWYEVEITPYAISFFVNGQQTMHIIYPLANHHMTVILNSGYTGQSKDTLNNVLSMSVKDFYYIKY